MSVTGVASSILSILSGSQRQQSPTQLIQSEFQQLGLDLQSGNLAQAKSDFNTLSKNLPSVSQNSAIPINDPAAATNPNPVAQAFAQLGQDLQSGNLSAAQQDFTTIREDSRQQLNVSPLQIHHLHHHRVESSEGSSSSSASQQVNPILQDFSKLAQSLQAGNLQSAQQAFSTLQTDLQQIGGFITSQPGGAGTTVAPPIVARLNVTV
jgi:outer membrane protein assembly factor BamD (BamD/ComL family)